MMRRRINDTLTVLHFAVLAIHALWTQKRVMVEWQSKGKTISISFMNYLFLDEWEALRKKELRKKK